MYYIESHQFKLHATNRRKERQGKVSLNLSNPQGIARVKQVRCPLSSATVDIGLCADERCSAFIESSSTCFYETAAGYGLDLIEGKNTASQNLLFIHNFQTVFRDNYDRIFNLAYRMLKNRETAEDITQEVFIRAYKSAKRIERDELMSAWLYRVATNICLDMLRKQKLHTTEYCTDAEIEALQNKFKCYRQSEPEEIIDSQEGRTLIAKVLSILPPHYCKVLVMHCVDGLSYEDIACTMDTTIASVRSMIFRARKSFIKLYAEFSGIDNIVCNCKHPTHSK